MSIQEIILGIVIVACVVWIIRRTALCFKRIRHKDNPCEGCPLACNTRRETNKNEKK